MRYLLLTAGRTRAPLIPLAATCFALLGVFASQRNEVGPTWGLAAVLCCALGAWLVGAVLAVEPAAQAEMAAVALGGRGRRAWLEVRFVLLVAAGLTVAFAGVPLVLLALHVGHVFGRPLELGDVVGAVIALLSCAILGGSVALALGPPRVTRRATSAALVLAVLVALTAVSRLGGPVRVAKALSDAAPGQVSGAELVACAGCLLLAGVAVSVAARAT
ncbi:MAG TPA: hypothetical protein VNS09_01615 [Solirubrobacter sp.]|nr:hypothetical protein [Solirubrobacter sp.]